MPDFRPFAPFSEGVPDWPCEPIIGGNWREVPASLINVLSSQSARCESIGAPPLPSPIQRMRELPLSFYPGWHLLEGIARYSKDADGVFRILLGPAGYVVLNGTSRPIHEMNAKHLKLSNRAATVDQYVRFFTSAVHGEAGPFRVIDSIGDLGDPDTIVMSQREPAASLVRPMKRHKSQDTDRGTHHFRTATLIYGKALFTAKFKVHESGMVEMVDDNELVRHFLEEAPSYNRIWQIAPVRSAATPKTSRSRDR